MRDAGVSDAPTMMPLPMGLSSADFARRVDPWMVGAAMFLLTVGIASVYSGSAVLAADRFGTSSFFLVRHLGSIGLGLALMMAVMRVPLSRWSSLAYPLLAVVFVLLLLTVASPLGVSAHGAARWLRLGPLRIQPAELTKLAVVVYLAHSLAKKRESVSRFSVGFLPHIIVVSGLVLLMLKQPDLGTSAVVYATLAAMLFVAGARTAYLVLGVLAALPVVLIYLQQYPHALRRIQVFLAPESDPRGAGYHIYQSLVAFGSGGPFGMGLGEGGQKLFFLPEPHTDFIYATIGQELGFVGAASVLVAFGVLIGRALTMATRLPCRFPMFLAFGVATWLGVQAFINMGVAVALLPTKGLTLPLLSFGRSSMVVVLVGLGILFRASAEERAHRDGPEEGRPVRRSPRRKKS